MSRIKRAIISVTDKTGVVEFARSLADMGVEILSTGGTARAIREGGVDVIDVADFTGFPEMLDGRVKTLHPKVAAGILYNRAIPDHVAQMEQHGLAQIDLVCVNLYAFEATVAKPDVTIEDAIENIDIGGPTMLRASAKNYAAVTVVVEPGDYQKIIDEMKANDGATTLETRFELCKKVYALTHAYDGAITEYLSGV